MTGDLFELRALWITRVAITLPALPILVVSGVHDAYAAWRLGPLGLVAMVAAWSLAVLVALVFARRLQHATLSRAALTIDEDLVSAPERYRAPPQTFRFVVDVDAGWTVAESALRRRVSAGTAAASILAWLALVLAFAGLPALSAAPLVAASAVVFAKLYPTEAAARAPLEAMHAARLEPPARRAPARDLHG